MLMPASTASRSIAASSSSVKLVFSAAARFSSSWVDAAGADEHRGHPLIAQRPGQRELGQGLAPGRGDLGQRADVNQGPFGNLVGRKRAILRGPRPGRHPAQVLAGEHALGQRREGDAAHALAAEHVEQAALDPPVQHRVGRLVDEQRRAQSAGAGISRRWSVRRNRRRCPRTGPCPTGPRCPARPSSPRAACPGRSGGSRRCRRTPGPSGAATGPGWPAGTCASRGRRRGPATCRSRPWWR